MIIVNKVLNINKSIISNNNLNFFAKQLSRCSYLKIITPIEKTKSKCFYYPKLFIYLLSTVDRYCIEEKLKLI